MKNSIHYTSVTRQDLSEITQRHKKPGISWSEARKRASAWVRAMSGLPAYPEPKETQEGFVSKRERPRPNRLKGDRTMRAGGSPWWKVCMRLKRSRIENQNKADAALLESAKVQAETGNTTKTEDVLEIK